MNKPRHAIEQGPDARAIDDASLIAEALNGTPRSFDVLVRRYWNMAVGLALSRLGDQTEAEDAAQEGFVKAYMNLRALRDPNRFACWLARIVGQEAVNLRRGFVRRQYIAKVERPSDPADRAGLTCEQRDLVLECIGRLPSMLREVVIMRFVGNMSATEIAGQLGKRPGAVRARLHRAYEILRKDLAPVLEEVEP